MSAYDTGAFPLPTISPPLHSRSRSRRLQQRAHRAAAVTRLANRCVESLNDLSTSFSRRNVFSSSPRYQRIRTRLLLHVYRASMRFVRRQAPALRDDISPMLSSQWESFVSPDIGYSDPIHSAVPLVASKVSLPSVAGTAHLLQLLPPHLKDLYTNPQLLLRDTPARCKARPGVLCDSRQEYLQLIQRLLGLGMVCLKPSVRVVNGIFAVPKDQDSQRLIIDARRANAVFAEPDHVELPTPDLLARLQAPHNVEVFAAKVDLDNFYHRIVLPEWMQSYFGLPPVLSSELGLPGPDLQLFPCCVTLPMGWSHSVLVAQACHEHLLNSHTRLSPSDRISASSDLRLDRSRHCVYIDDLILIGTDPSHLSELQQQYMAVVASVGLPPKLSKVVAPSSDGVECLGLEIDGVHRTVGLSVPKLQLLIRDTYALLDRGHCSGIDLAQLVGRWSWCVLCCRPAFAVFNAVYRFIQCARRRFFNLWYSVRRELSLVIGLAPLLYSSLDMLWFDRLVASDASTEGLGVVASRVPSDRIASIAAQPPVCPVSPPSLVGCSWATIVSSPWREPEHINVLELRAACTAVRWALSSPASICRRLVLISDSQVAVFSISKGRSSAFQILRRLRYLSALVLASGIQLLPRWVPSAANPADGASRLQV